MKRSSHMLSPSSKHYGFTLIELLITVVIAGIVASIAVPNMRTFMQNSRLSSTANEMLRTIQTARTEAIKRQQTVVMCMTADPAAAAPVCNTANITGWIVFQDTNNNWDRDTAEEVFERHTFDSTKVSFLADQSKRLSFAASGFANPAGGTPSTQTPSTAMVLCDERGNTGTGNQSAARGLVIANTGRVRMTRVVNSSTDNLDISDLLGASMINSTCPP